MERPKTTKNVGQPCVICGQSADAQAAIAALQAQLTQLDRTLADVYAQREGLQKDLAQRTAELAQILAAVDEGLALTDIRLAIKTVEETQAELERVRGERDKLALCGHDHSTQWWQVRYEELAALVAALPKVEGEIEIYTGKNTNQVVVTYKRGVIIGTLYGLDHAKPVAALYKHRQGMEG